MGILFVLWFFVPSATPAYSSDNPFQRYLETEFMGDKTKIHYSAEERTEIEAILLQERPIAGKPRSSNRETESKPTPQSTPSSPGKAKDDSERFTIEGLRVTTAPQTSKSNMPVSNGETDSKPTPQSTPSSPVKARDDSGRTIEDLRVATAPQTSKSNMPDPTAPPQSPPPQLGPHAQEPPSGGMMNPYGSPHTFDPRPPVPHTKPKKVCPDENLRREAMFAYLLNDYTARRKSVGDPTLNKEMATRRLLTEFHENFPAASVSKAIDEAVGRRRRETSPDLAKALERELVESSDKITKLLESDRITRLLEEDAKLIHDKNASKRGSTREGEIEQEIAMLFERLPSNADRKLLRFGLDFERRTILYASFTIPTETSAPRDFEQFLTEIDCDQSSEALFEKIAEEMATVPWDEDNRLHVLHAILELKVRSAEPRNTVGVHGQPVGRTRQP